MAVSIRLKRIGGKNDPCYRIVVTDKRTARNGMFIEAIGTYDPRKKENNAALIIERVDYWLKRGGQPTETVASLIKRARKQAAAAPEAATAA